MNTNYCISVDWLQVYCLSTSLTIIPYKTPIVQEGYKFTFKLEDYQSAMFTELITVKVNSIECATIQRYPRSGKLNKRMVLIKLENRILYSRKYISVLYALIRGLELQYKGITRIDLCYDCVKFADGRAPSRFINNFVMIPDNEIGGICRKGSDEFICHGKKAKGGVSKINYLSFGSPQSRIRAYIYDKTVELKEVKDKPWIRETWAENGIEYDEKNHVFRSEISIKAEGTDLLNMNTGELFRLSPVYLENQQSIEKLFHYYANKYLFFQINEGQKYRKNRRQLQLYKNRPEITCKPIHISTLADTGRSEKICYNKLERLSEQYSDLAEPRRVGLLCAMEFLKELEGIKSATLFSERYKTYLNELKGKMFYDEHLINYISSARDCGEAKAKLEAEYAYFKYQESGEQITNYQL